jgi:hypothetical protein
MAPPGLKAFGLFIIGALPKPPEHPPHTTVTFAAKSNAAYDYHRKY